MSRNIIVLDEAEEELAAAMRWYDSQRPGLGLELLDAVDEAVALLRDEPVPSTPEPGVDPALVVRRVFVRPSITRSSSSSRPATTG